MIRVRCAWPQLDFECEAILAEGNAVYALSAHASKRLLLVERDYDNWEWVGHPLAGKSPFFEPVAGAEICALIGGNEVARDNQGFAFYTFLAKQDLFLKHLSAVKLAASSHQGRWAPPLKSLPEHALSPWREIVIAEPGYLLPEWVKAKAQTRTRPSTLAD